MLRHVHYNSVDSIETLTKVCLATSVPIKSDLDEFFTNIFPCTNPVSPARRLMILHRTQQSTLIIIIIQKFITHRQSSIKHELEALCSMLELQTCIVTLYGGLPSYQYSMPCVHLMYPFLLLML